MKNVRGRAATERLRNAELNDITYIARDGGFVRDGRGQQRVRGAGETVRQYVEGGAAEINYHNIL